MHHLTVAVILQLDTNICGDKVYREFFGEPNSSPHGVRGAEQPLVSAAASSSAGIFE